MTIRSQAIGPLKKPRAWAVLLTITPFLMTKLIWQPVEPLLKMKAC